MDEETQQHVETVKSAIGRLPEKSRAREVLQWVLNGGKAVASDVHEVVHDLVLAHAWEREHIAPLVQALAPFVQAAMASVSEPAHDPADVPQGLRDERSRGMALGRG